MYIFVSTKLYHESSKVDVYVRKLLLHIIYICAIWSEHVLLFNCIIISWIGCSDIHIFQYCTIIGFDLTLFDTTHYAPIVCMTSLWLAILLCFTKPYTSRYYFVAFSPTDIRSSHLATSSFSVLVNFIDIILS